MENEEEDRHGGIVVAHHDKCGGKGGDGEYAEHNFMPFASANSRTHASKASFFQELRLSRPIAREAKLSRASGVNKIAAFGSIEIGFSKQ